MGDFVDRGFYSVETFLLLLALKVRCALHALCCAALCIGPMAVLQRLLAAARALGALCSVHKLCWLPCCTTVFCSAPGVLAARLL